jgi:hypothetical protein
LFGLSAKSILFHGLFSIQSVFLGEQGTLPPLTIGSNSFYAVFDIW